MQICPGSRNGKQNKVRCLLKHNILPINKGKLGTPQVLYNLVSNSAPLKHWRINVGWGKRKKLNYKISLLQSEAKLIWETGQELPSCSVYSLGPGHDPHAQDHQHSSASTLASQPQCLTEPGFSCSPPSRIFSVCFII